MSKIIASGAIRGSREIYRMAEERLNRAREEKGGSRKVAFPETAFDLPMAYTLLGAEVKTLDDMKPVLEEAQKLLPPVPSDQLWLPYLGDTLDAGIATLLSEEIIMAVRYLYGEEPQPDCNGFFTDTILRTLGIQLVDGRMPGFAAILGAAPDAEAAVKIIRELQKRSILIFAGSESSGVSIIDQLKEAGVEMGWDTYIVPYGRDTVSAIYPLNWAIRAALTFGGLKKGQGREALIYCKNRVFAFGLALGEVDDLKYATAAGAINMGFPVIADTAIPEIRPSGICTYEHVVTESDYEKIVPLCIETRGVKVTVQDIPIPVSYSPAFEGERVRKENMQVQFGGKYSTAFEYLKMDDLSRVEDGKIEVIGNDLDSVEEGGHLPLGIVVTVAGRKMQKDFESILERHIHTFINEAMGVMHTGQRNIVWLRISKDAYKSGFRLSHLGEILVARLHNDFGAIVDKVQVRIYTGQDDIEKNLTEATASYTERDERIAGMTDEAVDTFYSCTLCQSFAPNHVCIISPERLGLCGAYNWLDGKASHEINPNGPNQPVKKQRCLDLEKGQWEGINEFVYRASNLSLRRFSAYSMMVDPMTSCGCFECILAVIPEANGVMVVNREYADLTPSGMDFITLAGMVGGGVQTPGFLGVGRLYLLSEKFISGDGGLKRLVWLPRELKEYLKERLIRRGQEIGIPDFYNRLADETVAVDSAALLEFLQKVNHPALTMEPMF
ncbi:MAG: acetyl-CoA decarbonylase/synthase complex subunit alpha/beta [PVC group bacterium]